VEAIELRVGEDVADPYPRHWHDEYHLCAVTAGAAYIECGGTSHFTGGGSLFIVSPGEVHSHRKPEIPVSFQSVYIDASRLRSAAAEIGGCNDRLPSFRSGLLTDTTTRQGFLRLHGALMNSGSRLRGESLLLSFLVRLVVRYSGVQAKLPHAGKERHTVKRVREYLAENYAQTVSLDELAQLASLSPYHLHRMFSRAMGMPPHAYQLQVRIERARSLLKQNREIAEVAFATGFADQSHFTRHFKRLMAVTPGEYLGRRKNVQDGASSAG
jgi:AraC-like DNA-binding protein